MNKKRILVILAFLAVGIISAIVMQRYILYISTSIMVGVGVAFSCIKEE